MSQRRLEGDPNFPVGLTIQPSSLKNRRSSAIGGSASDGSRDDPSASTQRTGSSWDKDTEQDIQEYGIAGRIWEAAYLLALYLKPPWSTQLEFDPPCSIFTDDEPAVAVELGSGAGYGGLHLAQQLKKHAESSRGIGQNLLVLTDLANVVPLMERNIRRADLEGSRSSQIQVCARALAWGNEQDSLSLLSQLRITIAQNNDSTRNPITHLICSDLVYFPELLPPLLHSLITLSAPLEGSTKAPQLIISYKIRSLVKEQPFWSALGSWFEFRAVDCRHRPNSQKDRQGALRQGTETEKGDWHRFGSIPEDYNAAADDDQEMFIFVGERRPDSIGCLAPECDGDLMQGKRLRRAVSENENESDPRAAAWTLESASSGQDYFEWLLLSSMGAGI